MSVHHSIFETKIHTHVVGLLLLDSSVWIALRLLFLIFHTARLVLSHSHWFVDAMSIYGCDGDGMEMETKTIYLFWFLIELRHRFVHSNESPHRLIRYDALLRYFSPRKEYASSLIFSFLCVCVWPNVVRNRRSHFVLFCPEIDFWFPKLYDELKNTLQPQNKRKRVCGGEWLREYGFMIICSSTFWLN